MKKIFLALAVMLAGCAVLDPSVEVGQTLQRMNAEYLNKNVDGFMAYIDKGYDGKRDELQIAVENDFAGFDNVEYRTSVFQTLIDEQTGIYRASIYYVRTARSKRFGIDNQSGEAVLTFTKDENGLRLIKMSDPKLYGLIVP